MEFEFTLRFALATAVSHNIDDLLEQLGAAGCTDALVGIGQTGRIALSFTREAASAKRAIFSAIDNVKRAIPASKLLEVAPDFVGLTDVAALLGVSRQNMRKLSITHKDTFPLAMHEGSSVLWHLSPILKWLKQHGYSIEQSLMDVASVAMQINLVKEAMQIERRGKSQVLEIIQ